MRGLVGVGMGCRLRMGGVAGMGWGVMGLEGVVGGWGRRIRVC
jgi:hypothetical protein